MSQCTTLALIVEITIIIVTNIDRYRSSEPTACLLTDLFLLRSGQGQFGNRRLKELRP